MSKLDDIRTKRNSRNLIKHKVLGNRSPINDNLSSFASNDSDTSVRFQLSENKQEKRQIQNSDKLLRKLRFSVLKTIKKNSFSEELKLNEFPSLDNPLDKDSLMKILQKDPLDRSIRELSFLAKIFREVKFFDDIEKKIEEIYYFEMLRYLEVEIFERGDTVFKYQDVASHLYIILEGAVYVLLKRKKLAELQENTTKRFHFDEKRTPKDIIDDSDTEEPEKIQKLEASLKHEFWVGKTLMPGESFGEIGLDTLSTKRRTASILCAKKCVLVLLNKEKYIQILDHHIKQQKYDKIKFFEGIDLFKHWSYPDLSSLLHQMEQKSYPRGTYFFHEGDAPTKIFFIRSGQVELLRTITINENITSLASKNSVKKNMTVSILNANDYFGEIEILNNRERAYTARVTSAEAVVMEIKSQGFIRMVFDQLTIKKLKVHIRMKETLHASLIEKFIKVQHEINAEKKSPEKMRPEETNSVRSKIINLDHANSQNSLSTSRMYSSPIELHFMTSPSIVSDRSTIHNLDESASIKRIITYQKTKNERVMTNKNFKEFQDRIFKNLHDVVQEANAEKQKSIEEEPETYNFVTQRLPPLEITPKIPQILAINEDSKLEDYFNLGTKTPQKRILNFKHDIKTQHAKRLVGSLNLTKVLNHVSFSESKSNPKTISKDPFLYSLESEILKLRNRNDVGSNRFLFDYQPSFEQESKFIEHMHK